MVGYIDIVSYVLKVSVNGVICVLSDHQAQFESMQTSLTVNIHQNMCDWQ